MYRAWLAGPGEDEPVRDQDQWDVLTAEPRGVDYLEEDAGGVPALWAVPKGIGEPAETAWAAEPAPAADAVRPTGAALAAEGVRVAEAGPHRVLLCLHGGGFVSGSVFSHRKMFAHLAKAAGVRALSVDYTLLPAGGAHPLPVEQALTAYEWLLGRGVQARHIAFAGDSAGGTLALTAQLHARERGLPLPAATLLMSPWVDLAGEGASMAANEGSDALFNRPWLARMAEDYLAGTDSRDPLANALFADLSGLGPLYAQAGDQEMLLDDSRRLVAAAEKAGVPARLDVFAGMQHSFQMMAGRAPEADEAIARLAAWLRPHLGL
jgi:acetyl esterase/lipase